MNIANLKQSLNLLFKHQVTPLIVGAHGIGKTSIVSQFCAENGYLYVMQALGTKEAGDIQGLLDTAEGTSKFMPPVWVASLNNWAKQNPDKYAVLHLDEINHIHKDMQAVLFGALLGNQIGDVKMEPNIRYVGSMNPPTKDYPGVFDFRNLALVDRFCHIDLRPTVQEWATFAKSGGIDQTWVDFFVATPQLLDPPSEAYDVFKKIKGSRRSAIKAAQLAADGASDEILEGIIGPAAVSSFAAYRAEQEANGLDKKDILGRKSLTKKTRETLEKWVATEQYGKLDALCNQIKAEMMAMQPNTGTQQDADRITDLVLALPVDMGYAFCLDLLQNAQSINMKFDSSVNPRIFKFWYDQIKAGKVTIKKG